MGERINIQNLIDLLAEKKGLNKKEVDLFLKEMFSLIEEALEKDKYLKIKGFGTFKLIAVDSRESVNVNTGERIEILGHTKISFTPEASIRDQINRPFSHFETVILNDDTVFVDMPQSDDLIENSDLDPDLNSEDYFPNEELVEQNESVISADTYILKENFDEKKIQDQLQSDITQLALIESTLAAEEKDESSDTELPIIVENSEIEDHSFDKTKVEITDQENNISEFIQSKKQPEKPNIISPIEGNSNSDIHPVKDKSYLEDVKSPLIEELISAAKAESITNKKYVRNYTIGYFVVIILFLFVFLGGIFTYIYSPDFILNIFSSPIKEHPYESVEAVLDTVTNKVIKVDTLLKEKNIDKNEKKDTIHTIITGLDKINLTNQPDSTSFKIVGTMEIYKVKAGENLIKISKQFYNSKNLWPYIIKHNRKLRNGPNNLTEGVVLSIPALRDKKI